MNIPYDVKEFYDNLKANKIDEFCYKDLPDEIKPSKSTLMRAKYYNVIFPKKHNGRHRSWGVRQINELEGYTRRNRIKSSIEKYAPMFPQGY